MLDQNLGPHVLELVRQSEICPRDQVTSLQELGYGGDVADEDWMQDLGSKGPHIAITRDGNILNVAVRRNAWLSSGIGLILLDKQWGGLPRKGWLRALLYWWPSMTARALESEVGSAWTVACKISEPAADWMRKVKGQEVPR